MIWGCICWYGVGTLTCITGNIFSEKYKTILEDNIWPVIARHFPDNEYLFQGDNAPVHRSAVFQEYKDKNNLKSTSWPAQPPDLNIIENIWLLYILKEKWLTSRHCVIYINEDLFWEINKIWMDIPPCFIQNLYLSIPNRIMSVIHLKGHIRKY